MGIRKGIDNQDCRTSHGRRWECAWTSKVARVISELWKQRG